MKMNAKTGARAKILAYVGRNGLSPLAEIMVGIEEPNRERAHSNLKAAAADGLVKSRRDDVTGQSGYEITEAGKAWLKAAGEPKPKAVETAEELATETPDTDALVSKETAHLLGVLADIRAAVGDKTGKIMLGDLAEAIKAKIDALENDRIQSNYEFEAIGQVAVDYMPDPNGSKLIDSIVAMDMLIDAQAEQISLLQIDKSALHSFIDSVRENEAHQHDQITELRARVEAQILANVEHANGASQLLTEVHNVLANGWPVGVEAPTGRTTLQLAQAIAKDFNELYCTYLATLSPTPDAYLVTRNDDRGVTRHKNQDAAQRKAKAVVRACARKAEIYAVTRVAKAVRGPVIETR